VVVVVAQTVLEVRGQPVKVLTVGTQRVRFVEPVVVVVLTL
jgi:hypothetical protein